MTHFTPLSALIGGALIGLSASLLLVFNGRIAGISGIVGGLFRSRAEETSWRALFLAGLLAGGAILLVVRPSSFGAATVPWPLVIVAGLLVGFGSRLGGGCTSGHGVCGLGRGAPRSLGATLTFMATGVLAATLVQHLVLPVLR